MQIVVAKAPLRPVHLYQVPKTNINVPVKGHDLLVKAREGSKL